MCVCDHFLHNAKLSGWMDDDDGDDDELWLMLCLMNRTTTIIDDSSYSVEILLPMTGVNHQSVFPTNIQSFPMRTIVISVIVIVSVAVIVAGAAVFLNRCVCARACVHAYMCTCMRTRVFVRFS